MSAYWVTFMDGYKACVESHDGVAGVTAKAANLRNKGVMSVQSLPYAASPVIGERVTYRFGDKEVIEPTFCYRPNECAGHGCCTNPNGSSCTE